MGFLETGFMWVALFSLMNCYRILIKLCFIHPLLLIKPFISQLSWEQLNISSEAHTPIHHTGALCRYRSWCTWKKPRDSAERPDLGWRQKDWGSDFRSAGETGKHLGFFSQSKNEDDELVLLHWALTGSLRETMSSQHKKYLEQKSSCYLWGQEYILVNGNPEAQCAGPGHNGQHRVYMGACPQGIPALLWGPFALALGLITWNSTASTFPVSLTAQWIH